MPDPLLIAAVVLAALCLLDVLGLGVMILIAGGMMTLRTPDRKAWRSLRKAVQTQADHDRAVATFNAAGRGLGYELDPIE